MLVPNTRCLDVGAHMMVHGHPAERPLSRLARVHEHGRAAVSPFPSAPVNCPHLGTGVSRGLNTHHSPRLRQTGSGPDQEGRGPQLGPAPGSVRPGRGSGPLAAELRVSSQEGTALMAQSGTIWERSMASVVISRVTVLPRERTVVPALPPTVMPGAPQGADNDGRRHFATGTAPIGVPVVLAQ